MFQVLLNFDSKFWSSSDVLSAVPHAVSNAKIESQKSFFIRIKLGIKIQFAKLIFFCDNTKEKSVFLHDSTEYEENMPNSTSDFTDM